MKSKTLSSLIPALFAIVSLADRVSADIVVVAPTTSTPGSLHITADITFTITTAGLGRVFVFDEWVSSDGGTDSSLFSPAMSISINGNLPGAYPGGLVDNNLASGQWTPNDGFIIVDSSFSVIVGDTVTLKAGTFSLEAVPRFNPQATQTFTGNMFVTSASGIQLSNTVAVPEPCDLVLGLTAGVAGLFVRRRKGG
jgi:hypothetical protein